MELKSQAPRTDFMNRLNSIKKRVIYIHAPAGFGKTTSSLLWLKHRKASWVSFDEYDNKISGFCRRIVSALIKLQPLNEALGEFAEHTSFNKDPVEFTLQALEKVETQTAFVFVLDDLHIITNNEILKLLPIIIKRLPDNCTVLLLSRTVAPGSFCEMITKEEVAVIDSQSLQFSGDEIKSFFANNAKHLSKSQADEVLASTGGWAIAIRALLLSDEKSYNVNISGQYLENFIKSHVWERWDERLRKFMMLVSVAEELTPELCEWLITDEKLLKKQAGESILSELLNENAFLRKTGENTYRFHDLFRDFLIRMLGENGEHLLNGQRTKAGNYFYANKDYFRSVEYYLKGKNDAGVAKSLYCMYDYNSPYASIEDTLNTVHLSVNDSIVKKFPFLLEVQAWAAYVQGASEVMEELLDKYYKLSPKIILQHPRSAILLVLLRCMDYRESFINTMKTLRRIPFKGSFKAATPSLSHNLPLFHRSSRDFSEFAFDTEKNIALTEKALETVIDNEHSVMTQCICAGIYYEKGELSKAHEHALKACVSVSGDCSPEMKFCGMMILASVLFAGSHDEEARRVLDDARDMIKQDKAFYLSANLKAFTVRRQLSDGDKNAAKEWLKNCNGNLLDNLSFFKIYQYFTTARAYIVTGNYTQAALILNKLLQLSERYRRTLDIIESNILLAIIYWKKERGGQNIALNYLERAVITADVYKYTQVFANEGAELVNMLHRLQKRSVQVKYSGNISASFVKTLYITAVAGSKLAKGLTSGNAPVNLTFTDKQKTVMKLMSEGCSRNDIAQKMGLKPNGVKSHTELIYKKLNVSNSVEAVLKIRELGVLDDKLTQG
jgi:LuxR family maltose regulon positive regulatory protein